MRKTLDRRYLVLAIVSTGILLSLFFTFGSHGVAMQEDKPGKKMVHENSYTLYQSKCLGCHISVADPEKAGRTRDDWHLVVQVMHQYGLELTDAEGDMIIDLLYDLRKGMEREAG